MNQTRRWQWLGTAVLGLVLATGTGCQTWMAGLTLPSPHYLRHQPQYFPDSPEFPLQEELIHQEEARAAAAPPAVPPGAP
jgi:hypothetical protein